MMNCELTLNNIEDIVGAFALEGTVESIEECRNGHINSTYFVTCKDADRTVRYVLQRINTSIFTDPDGLMKNISAVTHHIREKYKAMGYADHERRTLRIEKTRDGAMTHTDSKGNVWRVYDFVENATCYQTVDSPSTFEMVGESFGIFQRDLADFDASVLCETIRNFHNTESRLADLRAAVEADVCGRASGVREEILFAFSRAELCSAIVKAIEDGRLPLRVTHNDTKLNNIMIDNETGKGICVIDLDTVMSGSVLYDFGDSIRFGASSAAEDETDLEKVYMREEMFSAFTKGFLGAIGKALTDEEILSLPIGAIVITLETGIRFLTDHLNGDTYFRTEYPAHNLDRARNQFKLVEDMESKLSFMQETVASYLR